MVGLKLPNNEICRMSLIYHDHLKSSFIRRGVVSARIRKESMNMESGAKLCGDSILINLGKKVFAIADSPDWNTSASAEFLKAFSKLLQSSLLKQHTVTNGQVEDFIKNVDKIINETHHASPTTFSCLIVIPFKDGLKGLIMHCGDSCIYMVNLKEKKVSLSTKTNFNFVGRTRKLSQVELIPIYSETRFLLCSDGIHALTRVNKKLEHLIMNCFEKNEIDSVPDYLIGSHHIVDLFHDDVSVVALNPNQLHGLYENHTLIL